MKRLVFVYGSLKQGMVHNNYLANQRYIGVACTTSRYAMYKLSGYPALIDHEHPDGKSLKDGVGEAIWGELYEVSEDCVNAMDKLEGVNHDLYERRHVDLDQIHFVRLPLSQNAFDLLNGKKAECYFFRQPVHGARNCGSFWTS